MTHSVDWVIAALTFVGVLLIPTLAFMIRGAVRWTHVEDKLSTLVEDIHQLVADKDKTHAEMLSQMRLDREVTDKRLRYIEEYFMEQGRKAISRAREDS